MADQNKTEKATPRRRQKAREQGQVARSRDLTAGIGTMVAVVVLAWQMRGFATDWRAMFGSAVEAAANHHEMAWAEWRKQAVVFRGFAIAAGLGWVAAMAAGLAQGGLVISGASLSPKLERLNPASRFEQLFSISALSRMLKSLIPTAVIVYLAAALAFRDWKSFAALLHASGRGAVSVTLARIFEIAWKAALVMLLWSAADYLVERRRHENELKMSRQELRDEYKEIEGNPAIKMRIRRLQRQARRRRQLKDVERAAVVITNPTQFAVALEYGMQMDAPVVVAKGRNLVAAQIKEVARWHGIPLVENPPLAHALYRAVDVGQAIPPKLYTVVAEILAAIWRAQARASEAATSAAAAGRS